MNRRLVAGVVLAAALVPGAVRASAQEDDLSTVPVRVEVTASEALRDALRACLKEKLQATPEVRFPSTGPALTLDVIATEQRMSDGALGGYIVYAGGYQPASACPGKAEAPGPGAVIIQWQVVRMVPPDLDAACRGVAADFTASVIAPTQAERLRLRQQTKPRKE